VKTFVGTVDHDLALGLGIGRIVNQQGNYLAPPKPEKNNITPQMVGWSTDFSQN